MKTNYLLPNQFKKIGWIIFIPVTLLGLLWLIFEFEPESFDIKTIALFNDEFLDSIQFFAIIENNIVDELLGILIIISGIFIAFSKEKTEDEFISKIRLESLVWATYLNYAILILAFVFIYSLSFFWVLVINMFTVLIFFIIRYNWVLYKSRKVLVDEK
ncbi:MAG: hypothetical protein PF484_12655 [Bacteroidales bacterium]|jgi:hypothetical protein|nr:hypothetical protein [Bacteroidales bacterium]